MRVERYPDVAAFWRDARGFLERDEMGNTQLSAIGADMTNPTANGIYHRIGFRPVGEHLHLMRDDP